MCYTFQLKFRQRYLIKSVIALRHYSRQWPPARSQSAAVCPCGEKALNIIYAVRVASLGRGCEGIRSFVFGAHAGSLVPSGAKHPKMRLMGMPNNWYRPAAAARRESLGARRDRRAPSGSTCTIPPGEHFVCLRPGVFKCIRVKFSGIITQS